MAVEGFWRSNLSAILLCKDFWVASVELKEKVTLKAHFFWSSTIKKFILSYILTSSVIYY